MPDSVLEPALREAPGIDKSPGKRARWREEPGVPSLLRAAARGERNRIETRSANGVALRQSFQRKPAASDGAMPFECLTRVVSAARYEPARAEEMRRQEDLVDTHERNQDPRGEADGVGLKPIGIGALVEQFARRLYGIRFQGQSGWHPAARASV